MTSLVGMTVRQAFARRRGLPTSSRRQRVLAAGLLAACVVVSHSPLRANVAPDPALPASEPAPAPAEQRLEGTFIQYQDWMMKLDAAAWRRELDAMSLAGIDIVIVQWLQMDSTLFMPADTAAFDPTKIILDYADRHGMKVFVGLSNETLWYARPVDEPHYLDRVTSTNVRIADEAWARYGRHPSFAAFYVSHEIMDAYYNQNQIALLRGFLRRLSDHCHGISGGKPLSIAVAFSGQTPPDVLQRLQSDLLTGSGVGIVMLEDGVGAHGWDADLEAKVTPYFEAMQNACKAAGVELWSDLEIFSRGKDQGTSIPAGADRVRRQLAAEAPFVQRFVTFDFFHHMSPYRGAKQKKLFEDYVGSPKSKVPVLKPKDRMGRSRT